MNLNSFRKCTSALFYYLEGRCAMLALCWENNFGDKSDNLLIRFGGQSSTLAH